VSSTQRIAWTEERHHQRGVVNGIDMFGISSNSRRGEPRWVLSGTPYGYRQDFGKFDTTDEAKDRAELVLVEFVEKLGARF
jgi:hypothetical protein